VDRTGRNPLLIIAGVAAVGGAIVGAIESAPGHRLQGALTGAVVAGGTVLLVPEVAGLSAGAAASAGAGETLQIVAAGTGTTATVAAGTAAGTVAVNFANDRPTTIGDLEEAELIALGAGFLSLDIPGAAAAAVVEGIAEGDAAFSSYLATFYGTSAVTLDQLIKQFEPKVGCPHN